MRVYVTAPSQFAQTPDGKVWSKLPPYGYQFWSRYLEVFDEVHLIARTQPVKFPPRQSVLVDGPQVIVRPVAYYQGPGKYAKVYLKLAREIKKIFESPGAKNLRLPCPLGTIAYRQLRKNDPYGAEIIGDPYDNYSPGSVKHPMRPVFQKYFTHQLKQECAHAACVAYVTRHALQKRYPPKTAAFQTHYSSIGLSTENLVPAAKSFEVPCGKPVLISVGQFSNLNKGQDTLVMACSALKKRGFRFELRLIGDGKYRSEIENLAIAEDLRNEVVFLGYRSSGSEVYHELRKADLFILSSRQEGLPRAVIEAMSQGLPCLASDVGGTHELLRQSELFPPNHPGQLEQLISEMLENPERMSQCAATNLEKVREYTQEILQTRRNMFYQKLRGYTFQNS